MTGGGNITNITDFILLGFSDFPQIVAGLFVVFLLIYILTLTWNLCLIVLIRMDSHLHMPMYFFLSNLSFIDICYVSSTAPKMLYDFFQAKPTITIVGCAIQYFVFSTMGMSESYLMTVMAYDRYAAICNPLLYSSVMTPSLCGWMMLGSYMAGLSASLSQVCAMLQLHFCGPNVIHHFFCDLPQLLVLSCSDTFFVQLLTAILTVIFGIINALVIMMSYVYIVISIMKITSAKGRSKAFNTCASHLTAVTLFYTSGMFVYLSSSSGGSSSFDRFASVFYTVVIPMLNPLIYSLRNKDIKDALKRLQRKRGYYDPNDDRHPRIVANLSPKYSDAASPRHDCDQCSFCVSDQNEGEHREGVCHWTGTRHTVGLTVPPMEISLR
ncbi:olfactory receptor 5AN1-like [Phacochoerus africanus]|uniref:olfactory receptor 5AN1-like n=1 Tax=Phacochoerus africanus TaxID=41426 RepID=UPI001FD8E0E8|nr:olfactory receptor 5AN1-like [Phacochoerus africanus]